MSAMVNMTTRRTDKEVLSLIREALQAEEVLPIRDMATRLDCHPLTVIRSIDRLETLNRLSVDRTRKPNRYSVKD